ncbi:MAG: glutamate-1-semialdehyde 2,1-aminomutase [Methylacidiphilales bacterium]|nr:glutamate-1-semialdehyde 2,1-aminomutase [Candidatus Methylacidiphilales bacterium]MDW8348833.1 glutamate-1-semialdehyde 2,1-aminomutase [Verrucomicrobiae bacterium]
MASLSAFDKFARASEFTTLDSTTLFARAKKVLPGGVNSPVRSFKAVGGTPFFVQHASGSRLFTCEGRALIDYVGSWGPMILGHAHPEIISALSHALPHGTSYGVPNPYEVEIAEWITQRLPWIEKIRFTNSGTEAALAAIRLARGYTRRPRIIKFSGCYHGHVDSLLVKAGSGALTLSQPDSAGIPDPLASLTFCLPFNQPEALDQTFEKFGEEIAAVILEPYPANAGLIFPRSGFLEHLRKLCDQYGALLIFDEVMTGFRVSLGGIQALTSIKADLTLYGKIIGGGLPVGAIGGRADIMDHLAPEGPVYQAGTLSGNPLAMIAGLTQLRLLEDQRIYETLENLGSRLETGIREILKQHSLHYCFHRIGSMFTLFFTDKDVIDLETALTSNRQQYADCFHKLLAKGIYWPPSQFETAFISAAHSFEDIDRTLDALDSILQPS